MTLRRLFKPKFSESSRNLFLLAGLVVVFIAIPLTVLLVRQSEDTGKKANAAATRDPYKQPFASNSPWNMPIGSGAQYGPETLGQPSCYETGCRFFVETEYIFLDPTAPLVDYKPGNGGGCSSSQTNGQVRIPTGVTFGGGGGDNDTGGALRSDNTTINEWYNGCRTSGTGPLYGWGTACQNPITGPGVQGPGFSCYGGHGGSGLSSVGGSLRTWELAAGTPIRHTLKLTLSATLLNNDADSPQCNDGFRWPAIIADGGWNSSGGNSEYSGSVKNRCMGSLLALPKSNTCSTGTELTKRVCAAMRDYGAYVVDIHPLDGSCYDCWRPFALNGEPPVEAALNDNEMISLISALQTITNNSSSSIGGGGTPLVPMIEDICPTLPCGTGGDQPPTVSVTSPANGSLVSGVVNITANPSDDIGINKVEFYVDGTLKSTDTTSPYSYGWDTTGLTGSHTIYAKAFDTTNQTGQSSTVTVNIGVATSLWCEAESSTEIAPMVTGSDAAASGGSYIYTTGNDVTNVPPINTGSTTLTFNIPTNGTYTLWSRLYYTDDASNSYFAQFDASSTYYKVGNDNTFGVWQWVNWHDGDVSTTNPITVSLNVGSHTLKIYGREVNTRVDKVLLTNDGALVPSGTGGSSGCSSTSTPKPGDITGDGSVGVNDLNFLINNWGTTNVAADLNHSGKVDLGDLSILVNYWGT